MIDVSSSLSMNTMEERNDYREEVLRDLWYCLISREASLLGRKEVLTGKAKFGIFGDGKEVPQVAMARAFKKGDWRSGYYRDQTFMMALELSSVEDFFAQLYADTVHDPFTGGRQMNSHYSSPNYDQETGAWNDHMSMHNISADVSCTAGQIARAFGLAMASKKFREIEEVEEKEKFSQNGNEVCFATIGDASTSEGAFWEGMNAATVHKVPLLMSVWDDGYGISVPVEMQTAKGSISRAMEGFLMDENGNGIHIYTVKAWDYPSLVATYDKVAGKLREEHRPALLHVLECTQPQGHSTSGSHERYKSKERLQWEREHDCIEKMIEWMLENKLITLEKVEEMRIAAKSHVKEAKNRAWQKFTKELKEVKGRLSTILHNLPDSSVIEKFRVELDKSVNPFYSEIIQMAKRVKINLQINKLDIPTALSELLAESNIKSHDRYATHLYSEGPRSSMSVDVVNPMYDEDAQLLNGYQILNQFFDKKFEQDSRLLAFGEDVGKIGDVNQGFAGLQEKYGSERVYDSGIREWTIMGQAIGLAMRGFRPIAEIQYLDYLIYGLSPLSDDLATLRYRSNGIMRAPAIIRTRGHRLEGIWHAGSPMGMMVNSLRGMVLAVPRNMTKAAGMYNTLLASDDPGIVVECLNGYRRKEKMPNNLADIKVPLGIPEILQEGNDITLVTYGSCVREAEEALLLISEFGISVELIDVQTLLPFDTENIILQSIKKTNKIIFLDEDVPGGGTAYMMQEVLEKQGGYQYLDHQPITISGPPHRPPYGSDGAYFCKPNPESIGEKILEMIQDYDPGRMS